MKAISDNSTLAFIVGKSIDMMAIQLPKTDLFQFFLNEDNKSELAEKLRNTGFPRKEVDYTMPRKVFLQQCSLDGSLSISWTFEASIYDFEKLVAAAHINKLIKGDATVWVGDKQMTEKLALTGLNNLLGLMAMHDTDFDDPIITSILKDFKAEIIADDEACEVFGNMSYDAESLIADGFAKMDFRRANFGYPDFVPETMTLMQNPVYDF